MKLKLIIICVVFCFAALNAQTSKKIDDANATVDKTSSSVGNTGNSIENASNAINGLWKKGVDVFKGKKKDKEQIDTTSGSYQMIVKNVEYDNSYFNQIFIGIKSIKDVSSLKKAIDENVGSFTFNYNGDISEIWDGMDSKLRQHFKVEKLTTNSIILSYKDK